MLLAFLNNIPKSPSIQKENIRFLFRFSNLARIGYYERSREKTMDSESSKFTDSLIDPDQDIVELFESNLGEALNLLIRRYRDRAKRMLVKRFGLVFVDNEIDAVLNETVFKMQSFDPRKGTLAEYFLKLSFRTAIDIWRKEHRHQSSRLQIDPNEITGKNSKAATDIKEVVADCLSKLSATERAIVEADVQAGGQADSAALAGALSTNTDVIYSLRLRARKKIRKAISLERKSGTDD